jgi:hypothetical protein
MSPSSCLCAVLGLILVANFTTASVGLIDSIALVGP